MRFISNNQIMILNLLAIRQKERDRYYYIKDSLRPQEFESITNAFLSDMDWIADRLKYYRENERNVRLCKN